MDETKVGPGQGQGLANSVGLLPEPGHAPSNLVVVNSVRNRTAAPKVLAVVVPDRLPQVCEPRFIQPQPCGNQTNRRKASAVRAAAVVTHTRRRPTVVKRVVGSNIRGR